VDDEVHPLVHGVSGRSTQGIEKGWIESGDPGDLVVKDRRAVRDDTVSLANRITGLTAKAAEVTGNGRDVDWVRGGGRRRTVALTARQPGWRCDGRRRRRVNLANRPWALTANDVDEECGRRRPEPQDSDECRADDYEDSEEGGSCTATW
jgi:hypothetical protein